MECKNVVARRLVRYVHMHDILGGVGHRVSVEFVVGRSWGYGLHHRFPNWEPETI